MARSRRIPRRTEPRLGRERRRPRTTAPPVRTEGRFRRLLRRVLGLRRRTEIDGVQYREARIVPLERALTQSRNGQLRGTKNPEKLGGGKRYEVSFPSGRSMPITATSTRRFADLMDVPELRSIRHAGDLVRPGSRVLILGAGTGGLAAAVAEWVGPHGGIVSVDHDGESVRFARRRYPLPSVSAERGGPETLAGEVDEAFDLVFVTESYLAFADTRQAALSEAWRVTRRGGRLVAIGAGEARTAGEYLGFNAPGARVSRRSPPDSAPALLVIERPDPTERGGDPGAPEQTGPSGG